MMIFIANSESWNQKPKGWKFLFSRFIEKTRKWKSQFPPWANN